MTELGMKFERCAERLQNIGREFRWVDDGVKAFMRKGQGAEICKVVGRHSKAAAVLLGVDTNTRWLERGGGRRLERGAGGSGASCTRDWSMGLAIIFLTSASSYGCMQLA